MRVLILSANTGGGHNSAAGAVKEAFAQRGILCEIKDTLSFISDIHSEIICSGHICLYRFLPKLFGVGYRFEERHPPRFLYEQVAVGAKRLAAYLHHNHFDAVVSTHIFGSMMMTEARRKYGLDIRHYLVVTDYLMYPGTSMVDVNRYFIGAEELKPIYMADGIRPERLVASGIPIRSKFLTPLDRAEARRQLHLPEQGPVVLLFSGSIGCGRFTQVVPALEQQLPEDASLVVICGNNQRLADRLRRNCGDRCRIIGFTKRVADYMAAADVCISKPGGLSTTEMLTVGLPMVLMHSVPGCETHNLKFFTDARGAVGTDQWSEAIHLCAQLVRQPDKLTEMRQHLLALGYPGGAEVVARTVIEDYEQG